MNQSSQQEMSMQINCSSGLRLRLRKQATHRQQSQHSYCGKHRDPQDRSVALRPGPLIRTPAIRRVLCAGSELRLRGGVRVKEPGVVVAWSCKFRIAVVKV